MVAKYDIDLLYTQQNLFQHFLRLEMYYMYMGYTKIIYSQAHTNRFGLI